MSTKSDKAKARDAERRLRFGKNYVGYLELLILEALASATNPTVDEHELMDKVAVRAGETKRPVEQARILDDGSVEVYSVEGEYHFGFRLAFHTAKSRLSHGDLLRDSSTNRRAITAAGRRRLKELEGGR